VRIWRFKKTSHVMRLPGLKGPSGTPQQANGGLLAAPLPAAALAGAASGKVVLGALSFRNDLRSKAPGLVLIRLEFLLNMVRFSSFPGVSSS
jgi:hypothetical protein